VAPWGSAFFAVAFLVAAVFVGTTCATGAVVAFVVHDLL